MSMPPKKNPLHSTLSALQAAEARVEQLRTKARSVRVQVLKDLHVRLGFASRRDLVEALLELDGGGRGTPRTDATTSMPTARRKRARITPEMTRGIIEAIKAGDASAVVGKRFGVSVQSVQNIKKAAGLVRKRK
jgi:hypothetical protein